MKADSIRVLDVFVIGPAMIAGGAVVYKHAYDDGARRALGAFLIFAGVGTSIYNGNNWLKSQAAREAAAAAREGAPKAAAPGPAPPEAAAPATPLAPRA